MKASTILAAKKGKIDLVLTLVVFILVILGLVMISSSSVVLSQEKYGENYYFLKHQFYSLIVGIVVWITFTKIDYRFWQKIAFWFLLATLVFLILVFIPGIGLNLGGAHRWISIGPIFFQPSEIAKLTFIMYLAAWFSKKGEGVKDFSTGFLPFILILGIICTLIIKQPDMGTMSVIAGVAAIMAFVAGADALHLALAGISITGLIAILIFAAPYRLQRLITFIKPNEETLGAAYHINQALIAIGSGGLFGLGFGQSKQKFLYLPQAHTDSIFAIICEEMGFLRAIFVILLFVILGIRGYQIAQRAPDNFSKLLATGITSWFVVQAFINIAAMLGLLPLTGVPLPFVSFGGSALVISLAAVGILLNISKQTKKL